MSNIPIHPQAFENLLLMIICTEPSVQLAKVKPHLLTFISHPIIKELIGQVDAPALPAVATPPNLKLQKIQGFSCHSQVTVSFSHSSSRVSDRGISQRGRQTGNPIRKLA